MRVLIETPIPKNFREVFSQFNRELFVKLKPPFINLVVERFDGCKKGHEVHLSISSGFSTNKWISLITDFHEDENEIYFIDKGTLIPPPIKTWTHKHSIKKISENECLVIDDIEFSTGNTLTDKIIYPALYAMFLLRKPIYKRELS